MRAIASATLLVALTLAPAQAQMSNAISGDLNAGYGGGGGASMATPNNVGSGAITAAPGMIEGGGAGGYDLTRQSPLPSSGAFAPSVSIDIGRGPVSGRGDQTRYR